MSTAALITLGVSALLTAGISGVLGMGGGVTLLAVMAALMPAADVVPLHGVVQLSSNTTRAFALLRSVHWRTFFFYAPFAMLGLLLATWIWQAPKLAWFRPLIGLFILGFLIWQRAKPKLSRLPRWTFAPVGLAIGFAAIFVGATGPLQAPFFLRDDWESEQIVATKAACQLVVHLFKVPAFLSLGYDYRPHLGLLAGLVVAVVAGTYLGRAVLRRLPQEQFRLAFKALLSVLALYLIFG